MRYETELSHIDSTRVIVRVSAWSDQLPLGSTLAQADNVDLAESKAISKLNNRLNKKSHYDDSISLDIKSSNSLNIDNSHEDNLTTLNKQKPINISQQFNPKDWSKELALIDNQISRLSWEKQDENLYLEKLLGYTNRTKITNYTELKILLSNLESLKKGVQVSQIVIDKEQLIIRTTELMNKLEWDTTRGRKFIKESFNCNTRNELTQLQLLKFIMLLEQSLMDIDP